MGKYSQVKTCIEVGNMKCTVEGGELRRWCELGQNFSDSSPLLLLVKGHWCAILQKCSAL